MIGFRRDRREGSLLLSKLANLAYWHFSDFEAARFNGWFQALFGHQWMAG
jgi:hypothetical protein